MTRKVAIVLLAMIVTTAWMWSPGHAPRFDNADCGYPGFRAEVYGGAPKGICYRVFVPYLARAVQDCTPGAIRGPLASLAGRAPLREMQLDPQMMPAYAAVGAVSFAAYLALGLAAGPLALLLAWAAIGPHGGLGDPVTLGAFSVAIWALQARRTRLFWACFAVAALNRETAPLLLAWWLLAGRSTRAAVAAVVAWCVMRGVLASIYADNSLEMAWPMFVRNAKLIQPLSLTTTLAYLFGGLLVLRGLRELAPWQRQGWWVGVALIVPMALLWSRPERARGYLELLPVAAMAMERGLATWRSTCAAVQPSSN